MFQVGGNVLILVKTTNIIFFLIFFFFEMLERPTYTNNYARENFCIIMIIIINEKSKYLMLL